MINCIHHRSGFGSRLCDSSLAAVMPTVSARAKAKAKASLRTTRPRKRRVQLRQANDRQDARRAAVRLLRELATQLGVDQVKVPTKRLLASEPKVERLIRALQGRCVTAELQDQLRHAVQQWSDHGGVLSQPILPPTAAGTPPTQQTAETETPPAVVAADDDDDDVSPLPQHKILTPGFILKSSAFMMTFNSTTASMPSKLSRSGSSRKGGSWERVLGQLALRFLRTLPVLRQLCGTTCTRICSGLTVLVCI